MQVTSTYSAKTRLATLWKAKTGSEIVILLRSSYWAKNTEEKNNDLSKVIANRWTNEADRIWTAIRPSSGGWALVANVCVTPATVTVQQKRLKLVVQLFLTLHTPGCLKAFLAGEGRTDEGGERWQADRKEKKDVFFSNLQISQMILLKEHFSCVDFRHWWQKPMSRQAGNFVFLWAWPGSLGSQLVLF